MGIKIKRLERTEDVYDITVDKVHNFFGNNILVHNCEINLPTKPLNSIDDEEGEISLCTLSAINFGKIKKLSDFEKPSKLLVRALNELLDYQEYPIKAAKNSTMNRRPLGIGVVNFAYWLAKNDSSYTNPNLELIHEYFEAFSYYLIKASADLAKERGEKIPLHEESLYCKGILPIDTYKRNVDELVNPKYNMDWESLRDQLREYGIYNSTLMALMPSETSSLISNSTSGIEPPRSLVSIKQSKDGVFAQVVPGISKLKNKYELLWDINNPKGYLDICAVIQKFVDQGISVNTSYNPLNFPSEKISMEAAMKDILNFYKYGGKQLYYNNMNDGAGEKEIKDLPKEDIVEEDCDSCKI